MWEFKKLAFPCSHFYLFVFVSPFNAYVCVKRGRGSCGAVCKLK